MPEYRYESPRELLGRLKLGREEFVQRLTTSLIVAGPYPKWNSTNSPSDSGLEFLKRLHRLSFDSGWEGPDAVFIDECDFEGRTAADRGGAPDWVVKWPDRVWIIELKTEVASHRHDQVPTYFDLGRYHHPEAQIDLTYLTPPMTADYQPTQSWARYSHLEWEPVAQLIDDIWGGSRNESQQRVVDGILAALGALDTKAAPWLNEFRSSEFTPQEAIRQGVALAEDTASSRDQRALDVRFSGLDDLYEMRDALNTEFAESPPGSPLRHVRAWKWEPSSLGSPLTEAGRSAGMEVRISYYDKPQW